MKKNDDLVLVRVGRAGVGRMGFKAWIDHPNIDRQDADDGGTYATPGEALAALGKELDRDVCLRGWEYYE